MRPVAAKIIIQFKFERSKTIYCECPPLPNKLGYARSLKITFGTMTNTLYIKQGQKWCFIMFLRLDKF